ncbi:hypothetical protein [Clostridium sp. MD294]|uniref:hypothetical protein n=1 Tax=Clostridium sp. MD294 TaxID=97138 RepID=UPI0002C92894|nr:hypothetical protein [Clostridium sp. MD294]NDO45417.1 hypothetical protein [Clostridium sp. MD294]USF30938.1 hypothetical protein C820_002382 [Clostridium sp. MD294]
MKRKINMLFCIMLLFLVEGCTKKEVEQSQQQQVQQPSVQQKITPSVYKEEKIFGTYNVYEDWVFLENYSEEESAFYIKKGEEITNTTTNISVEYRQNQYKKEEYDILISAILYQLKLELKQEQYHNLVTEEFTSPNGYCVFRIEVNDEQNDPPVKTIQHYIIGEKAHIVVQTTDFGEKGTENVEEVADNIVESFVWREIEI